VVDTQSHPHLQQAAASVVRDFCRRTGINLAGLDVIFAEDDPQEHPLLLEINYFFGRSGLGGSQAFYRILKKEIHSWLRACGA
jgi:ribosomal protein S6--L-glutamate ligase